MAEKSNGGGPSIEAPDIAALICEEIASGESLKKVCATRKLAAMSTVFLWIARYGAFSENYARAG